MSKAERLLFIVNLFRTRKKLTLEELQQECGVSKRTVFRDILALSSMNIPIYYDNGYRLARDISLPALNFTEDEQELIGFCLRRSCLCKSPALRLKLRNIELKIISAIPCCKKNNLSVGRILSSEKATAFSPEKDLIIATFLRAMFSNTELMVTLKNKKQIYSGLFAVSLNVESDSWMLVMTNRCQEKTISIPVEKVGHLKVI
nr:HTH domain-containing protein [candidate division Zixibacteria bacterium]